MKALLDTNVLLRVRDRADADHTAIRDAVGTLLERGFELCYCAQSVVEMWVALTRPRDANGWGLDVRSAAAHVQALGQTFTFVPDPGHLLQAWFELCERHEVRGRQAYDARIAALMQATGIGHLVTLNAPDFRRYTGLTLIDPSAS